MGAFYEVNGTIRVRDGPEVRTILDRLWADHVTREYSLGGITMSVDESEVGILEVILEGGDSFAAGSTLEFDKLLHSLGPHAVDPAVLTAEYEGEAVELVVARSDAESAETLSRHRLEQIDILLRDVTPEDRAKLVDKLRTLQSR